MNSQPKPAFYVAVGIVVLALVGFAIYRADIFAPKAKPRESKPIDVKELTANAEHPDPGPELMAKEYKLRPRGERLPDPAGAPGLTRRSKSPGTRSVSQSTSGQAGVPSFSPTTALPPATSGRRRTGKSSRSNWS